MNTPLKVLAIAGSNRKDSYNRALLKVAAELAPEDLKIEIYDLDDIPMFNQDLEQDPPAKINEFKSKISEADGLLIAAPEYNYSLSAILKNAIDWASRPANASPLDMKPAAIMGGTIGMSGTIRSQHHLRQVALWTNLMDMKKPEVYVVRVHEKFDENMNLIDEPLKQHLRKFLLSFLNWIRLFKNAPVGAVTPNNFIPVLSRNTVSQNGISHNSSNDAVSEAPNTSTGEVNRSETEIVRAEFNNAAHFWEKLDIE